MFLSKRIFLFLFSTWNFPFPSVFLPLHPFYFFTSSLMNALFDGRNQPRLPLSCTSGPAAVEWGLIKLLKHLLSAGLEQLVAHVPSVMSFRFTSTHGCLLSSCPSRPVLWGGCVSPDVLCWICNPPCCLCLLQGFCLGVSCRNLLWDGDLGTGQ